MDANFLISQCEREFKGDRIILEAKDKFHAEGLRRCCDDIARWGIQQGQKVGKHIESVVVRWSGDGGTSYKIPSFLAMAQSTPNPSDKPQPEEVENAIASIQILGEQQTLDLMAEQYRQGHIVIITGYKSNICRYTSNRLTPKRAYWTASQFHGYNYLESWRETMDQYEKLVQFLDRDNYVPGYKYELIRPDGAFCSYATDYYKGVFQDEVVRIGVSHPDAWSIIRPAPVG